jgi:hypothetical protein
MKKCIAGLLALVLLLSGCGAAEEKKETAPLDVAALYTQLEAVGVPQMLALDANMQLDLYGIRAEDVKQAKGAVASDGLLADEIWLLEAIDEETAQSIKELAEGRIRQKDRESVTYSPEQNAIVKKAVVAAEGCFVYLICSPNVDQMIVAVQSATGK